MGRRLVVLGIFCVIGVGLLLFLKRSIPFSDSEELLTATISIDSIRTLGPAATIYDKSSRRYYWLKSYTTLDPSAFDTLKSKKATIKYMKFLKGPLENRVYQLVVDSVIVFDQVVEGDTAK